MVSAAAVMSVVPSAASPRMLPRTTVFGAATSSWSPALPAITLPAPVPGVGVKPPTVLPAAATHTPRPKLPTAAVPAAFVPIKFPRTTFPVAPAPVRDTPAPALPLTTLPANRPWLRTSTVPAVPPTVSTRVEFTANARVPPKVTVYTFPARVTATDPPTPPTEARAFRAAATAAAVGASGRRDVVWPLNASNTGPVDPTIANDWAAVAFVPPTVFPAAPSMVTPSRALPTAAVPAAVVPM